MRSEFAPATPPTTAPTAAPSGPSSDPAAAPAAAPPAIFKPLSLFFVVAFIDFAMEEPPGCIQPKMLHRQLHCRCHADSPPFPKLLLLESRFRRSWRSPFR